jgi:transcriptional regulator NrdR family protein
MAAKIPCPHCSSGYSRVTDSRPLENGGVYRRRQCLACSRRFSTAEQIFDYPKPIEALIKYNRYRM